MGLESNKQKTSGHRLNICCYKVKREGVKEGWMKSKCEEAKRGNSGINITRFNILKIRSHSHPFKKVSTSLPRYNPVFISFFKKKKKQWIQHPVQGWAMKSQHTCVHVCEVCVFVCDSIWSIIIRGNSCMDLCGLKGVGIADNLWLLRQEAWRKPQEVTLRTNAQNRSCMYSSNKNKHSFQVHKLNDSRVCISTFFLCFSEEIHSAGLCKGSTTATKMVVCF